MKNGINMEGNIILESVNQTTPREGVSERYSFIPTTTILSTLKKEGWFPVRAQETKSKKHCGFQKHLIRLQNMNQDFINGVAPEIVLTNSHDAAASFTIMAGLFRTICLNGIVVSDSTFEAHRICHKGYTEDKVYDAIYSVMDSTPKILTKINEFKGIALTSEERQIFAESALTLKFGEEKVKEFNSFGTVSKLLSPRRAEDAEPNLWNTFNTIQEKFIKGDRYISTTENPLKIKKGRATNSISENIRLNKALWELTEKMAGLKNQN